MRLARAVAAMLFAGLVGVEASSYAQTAEEVVKAQFVYRFTSFAQWPAQAFQSPQSPIVLCVVGDDRFAGTLSRAAAGQRIGGRTFEVRRVRADQARRYHVVYAAGFSASDTLRSARGAPVLTITDAASGDDRGIIHFVVIDNRVRFHIDEASAAEANLVLDSRLLGLALSVRRRAGP